MTGISIAEGYLLARKRLKFAFSEVDLYNLPSPTLKSKFGLSGFFCALSSLLFIFFKWD